MTVRNIETVWVCQSVVPNLSRPRIIKCCGSRWGSPTVWEPLIYSLSLICFVFECFFLLFKLLFMMRKKAPSFLVLLYCFCCFICHTQEPKANDIGYVKNLMLEFLDDQVRAAGGLFFTEQEVWCFCHMIISCALYGGWGGGSLFRILTMTSVARKKSSSRLQGW